MLVAVLALVFEVAYYFSDLSLNGSWRLRVSAFEMELGQGLKNELGWRGTVALVGEVVASDGEQMWLGDLV